MVSATATILIMAGGTGGHVFPALAVAEDLRGRGHAVHWLGTRQGIEHDVVPREGFPIAYLSVKGLRGKGWLGWLLAPGRLLYALAQALQICLRIRPHAVLGMGGFVTGPGGVASWILRRPLVIHEQNAIPGMTNRWLALFASRVLQAFPNSFKPQRHALVTGNPVRSRILDIGTPAQRYHARQDSLHVLIIGGSLGAQALNELVPAALAILEPSQRPQVWHQAGRNRDVLTQQRYNELQVTARVAPFINDMSEAYAWADLVICRAGAMTVSELSNVGLASVLVPFPFAVDDHQTANARVLADAGAAIVLQQRELNAEVLAAQLRDLFAQGRAGLLAMAQAAQRQARPDATYVVAEQVLEVIHDAG
jgi:UDP-N-acetylglucosamine--N-acetylmuramyl-(pentapeptide) pyrophosphoryl-undecaprenol N-acetylglucosamine transferase